MDAESIQFKDGRIHMAAEEEPPTYGTGPNGRTKGPQLEDGFGRVANELAEKFSGARLSGPEHDILWLVVRFTYGWNRKKARITGAQMKHFTGRNIPRCSSILNGLIQKKILYREGGKFGEIGINTKDWEWIKTPSARNENLPIGGKLSKDENLPIGGKLEPENLPIGGKLNLPIGGNHIKKGKETVKTKEKKNAREKFKTPEWVPADVWEDFKAHRKAVKKPLTDLAAKRIVAKLDAFRKEGDCPEDVLNRSIEAGWTTVYFRSERNSKSNGDGRPKNKQGDFYGGGL